jgi:hypothetical protein
MRYGALSSVEHGRAGRRELVHEALIGEGVLHAAGVLIQDGRNGVVIGDRQGHCTAPRQPSAAPAWENPCRR